MYCAEFQGPSYEVLTEPMVELWHSSEKLLWVMPIISSGQRSLQAIEEAHLDDAGAVGFTVVTSTRVLLVGGRARAAGEGLV